MTQSPTIMGLLTEGAACLRSAWRGFTFAGEKVPQADAQLLLAHCMGMPRATLLAHATDTVTEEIAATFRTLIARRAAHEPIAYLLGSKPFLDLSLKVTPATLIPRPATEELVHAALTHAPDASFVMDVGTGSGVIAIALARALPKALIVATDISAEALAIAKENAAAHEVAERIRFLEGDLLTPIIEQLGDWLARAQPSHGLLVANLPYLSDDQWQTLDPDVRDFEPKTALVSGIDGLDHYRRLTEQLLQHRTLFPKTLTMLWEVDPANAQRAADLLQRAFPATLPTILSDASGRARFVSQVFIR